MTMNAGGCTWWHPLALCRVPAAVTAGWAGRSWSLSLWRWLRFSPLSGLPKSRDTGSMQSSSKTAFVRMSFCQASTHFYFFFLLAFLVFFFFFSPCKCLNCSRSSYIPNTVILSAALHTALLFKELPWILTALQAGNPVGPLLSCLLI